LESKKRSLVKALLWRIIGIFVLGLITWTYTKNIEVTTMVTLLFHAINFTLYYLHERLWDKIGWGLLKKSDLSEKEQENVIERLRKLGYLE
jgi:uncharacterized membrane protein